MSVFQVKVYHRSSERDISRQWQPKDEEAPPVHTESFDAASREVAVLMLQKKFPRYDTTHGFSFEVNKIY